MFLLLISSLSAGEAKQAKKEDLQERTEENCQSASPFKKEIKYRVMKSERESLVTAFFHSKFLLH